MNSPLFVSRPKEAQALAQLLTPDPIFGESAGLFLAGPRRTGKSTFLRRDLTPLLQEQGKIVLYVDLWSDREADPGQLINRCIAHALQDHDNIIARFRRNSPISAVGALGFRVDLKAAGAWEGTIPDALMLLAQAAQKDVVMIVDEAQHSLATEPGMSAMFALKAARDAVNQSGIDQQLYLVMTGSHRDKLTALVHDHNAPFFGGRVRDFPPLGRDYSEMISAYLAERMAPAAQLSPDDIETVFDTLGRRPERLSNCLREMFLTDDFSAASLRRIAEDSVARTRQEMRASLEGLTALQLAVLRQMALDGAAFAPFAQETRMALSGDGAEVSTPAVQKALEALRKKDLIWRPGQGKYVINDIEVSEAVTALTDDQP